MPELWDLDARMHLVAAIALRTECSYCMAPLTSSCTNLVYTMEKEPLKPDEGAPESTVDSYLPEPDSAVAEVEAMARDLEARILYRSEGGAFSGKEERRTEMVELIKVSREIALGGDIPLAKEKLLTAYVIQADIVQSQSLRWRLVNIWGVIPFGYYFFLLVVCLEILFLYPDYISGLHVLDVPVSVLFYGFFGGVLRGLWWLHQKVQEKHYRPQFTMPYLASPWMAMLFGVITWLLLSSGVLVLSSGESVPNSLAISTLVFIGGFSWEWGMQIIDRTKSSFG